MTDFPALIPSNAVELIGARTFTTSLMVAEVFGKQHFNVLRDIESLDCSPEFHALNFEGTFRNVPGPNGAVRQERAFKIYRDGFAFLAMGYTGPKAAAFKEAYIARFNALEAQRQAPAVSPIRPGMRWLAHVNRDGQLILNPLTTEDVCLPVSDWPKVIQTPDFPKELLPEVLMSASRRLLDMGHHQPLRVVPNGVAEQVLAKILEEKHAGLARGHLPACVRAYRNLSNDKRTELVEQMLTDGTIFEVAIKPSSGAGRPNKRLVAAKFVRQEGRS